MVDKPNILFLHSDEHSFRQMAGFGERPYGDLRGSRVFARRIVSRTGLDNG